MSDMRIQQLLQFYRDDPDDPFNVYALALEYLKYDRAKAKEFFDILLRDHQEYLPTYYHAAKLYQDLNQKEVAINTYVKGIALARQRNEHKVLRELQSAYDELIYE